MDELKIGDDTRVLVFHAHPDDEAFATAATTLALARAGAEVHLVIATGGEMGERFARPDLDVNGARAVREARLNQSCSLLGIRSWRYLTRPGQWLDDPDPSLTLAAAPTDEVAAAVRRVIDEVRPQIVLSVGPDGLTGHPDHIAMHDAVVAALALPGWSPSRVWGAVVRRSDVDPAQEILLRLGVEAPSGEGVDAVRGVDDTVISHTVHLADAELPHRQAMDLYHPGLGTSPLEQLVGEGLRGGSLVLRAVFDVAGADTEHFVDLRVNR